MQTFSIVSKHQRPEWPPYAPSMDGGAIQKSSNF